MTGEATGGAGPEDVRLSIYAPLARWLAQTHGTDALICAAGEAGLTASAFDDGARTVDHETAERWLQAVYWYCDDDRAFREAAGYRVATDLVLSRRIRPRTPVRRLADACVAAGHGPPGSSYEVLEARPRRLSLRYASPVTGTRLMCLARMGLAEALAARIGMPPVHVAERACLAHGDDACVYELRFLAGPSHLAAGLGLLCGGGLAFFLFSLGALGPVGLVLLPLLASVGLDLAVTTRAHRANLSAARRIGEALGRVSREEIDARRELQRLEEIRRQWANDVELVRGVEAARLRGFSHDLRNPLAVLRLQAELLRREAVRLGGSVSVIDEHLRTLDEVDAMVASMLDSLGHGRPRRSRRPVRIAELTTRTDRRLRALARGRPLSVSVERRPSAPPEVEVDALALERVLDNLMMNALKYTEQGTVDVEIAGADGGQTLVVVVRDTGQGIARKDLRSIFEPAGSDPARRRPGSYGLGLSVVVQLLHEMGGRIEVESAVGEGSAFHCFVPSRLRPRAPERRSRTHRDPARALVEEIVTVRPPLAS